MRLLLVLLLPCGGRLLRVGLLLLWRLRLLLALLLQRRPLAEKRHQHLLSEVHLEVYGRLLVPKILQAANAQQQGSLNAQPASGGSESMLAGHAAARPLRQLRSADEGC